MPLVITGCSDSTSADPETRYYEFAHESGASEYTMIASTSDPAVIEQVEKQLQKPFDERKMFINGDIARGSGANAQLGWHFIPGEWELAESAVEVCDGRPDMVDENLDYWVDQVGFFCPWSSRVLREVPQTADR